MATTLGLSLGMAQAGVTALFSQFITGMVDTGGNLGETFKRMGSEEGLTQTVTTVLTAGALEYLGNIPFGENGVKLGSINGKSPFTDQLGKNLIYGVTGAAMRSAMTGESFEDQLPSVFMLALLQSGAAKGAYAIGGSGLSDGMKLALHTALGCGVGAIKQDSSEGCAPGAMGALVAEVWANENGEQIKAESATPEDAKKEILDQSTFAGTIAGCVVGGPEGCDTGGMTGRNAVENNYLNHIRPSNLRLSEKEQYDAAAASCATGDKAACTRRDELTTLSRQRDQDLAKACSGATPELCNSKVKEARAMGNIVRSTEGGFTYANSPTPSPLNTATIGPPRRTNNFHDQVSKSTSEGIVTEVGNLVVGAVIGVAAKGVTATKSAVTDAFTSQGSKVGAVDNATAPVTSGGASGQPAAKLPSATDATDTIPANSANAGVGLRNDLSIEAGVPTSTSNVWGASLDDLEQAFNTGGATVTPGSARASSVVLLS